MDQLIRNTEEMLDSYSPKQNPKKGLISRVPRSLYEIDQEAYVPHSISIGPYHYHDQHLPCSRTGKLYYLKVLQGISGVPISDYYHALDSLEKEARSYYSEDIKMGRNDFLEMLLFDSSCLLFMLGALNLGSPADESNSAREISQNNDHTNGKAESPQQKDHEPVGGENMTENNNQVPHAENSEEKNQRNFVSSNVLHDLLLYENQIPFIVLERVLSVVNKGGIDLNKQLASLVETILKGTLDECIPIVTGHERPEAIHHLLHLFHSLFAPEKPPTYKCSAGCRLPLQFRQWRRAVEYHDVGIHFTKIEYHSNPPHSLLDIKFKNGKLLIPQLIIDDGTNCMFRNLIAFEQQTYGKFGDYITAYIFFMSHLLSMPEDVTLLSRKGIILHHLSSDEEVSQLFNDLGKSVTFAPSSDYYEYLESLNDNLENHYKQLWNHWLAMLRRKYFSNPWLVVGLSAGTITLVCVIVQTIFQVIS